MSKSLLQASLIAGLVVFIWGIFSWMVLPFHKCCMHKFKDECKVASVIRENAPVGGMYVLPNTMGYNENASPAEMRKSMEMMDTGPFMFAAVAPRMERSMGVAFAISYVTQVLGALIVTFLLSRTRGLKFWDKVKFVMLFGLGAGILGLLPAWNWVAFSAGYVGLGILELVISWFFAGLVLAKMVKIAK